MEKRHQKGECPRPRSGKGPGSFSLRETAFSVEFDPDTGGLRTWGRGTPWSGQKQGGWGVTGGASGETPGNLAA